MATETKVGGQADLAATTLTDIYTVPAGKRVIAGAVIFTNRAAAATTVRLSVAVNGAADALKQYLYYDVPLAGNDALAWTAPLPIAAGDVVRARAAAANVSAQVFVQETDVL